MRETILPQSRTIADNPFVSTKTFLFHSRHSFHRPVTGRQHSLHYLFNEKGNFIHDPSLSQYERWDHITDRKRKHFPDTKCFQDRFLRKLSTAAFFFAELAQTAVTQVSEAKTTTTDGNGFRAKPSGTRFNFGFVQLDFHR